MGFVNRIFIAFFFLSCFVSHAQQDFIPVNSPIVATTMRNDGKEIAFATKEKVYFLDIDSFRLMDSMQIKNIENKNIQSLDYSRANPDILLAKYTTYTMYGLPEYKQPFFEYPQDSIVFYNMETHLVQPKVLPGNYYFAFGSNDATGSVLAYNDYFEYKDDYGNLRRGAKKGELYYTANKVIKPSSGIVRHLKIAPQNTEVAIVYYDSLVNNIEYQTIELRSLPEMEIKAKVPVSGHIENVEFGPKGNYLVASTLDASSLSKEKQFHVFSTENLKPLETAPEDLIIPGLIKNQKSWKFIGNELVQFNLNTNEKFTRIWANLTPLSSLEGFFVLNDNDVIIYGSGNESMNTKSGFYKYSLKDNAIYSNVTTAKVQDTLYDPNKVIIQNNTLFKGKKQLSQDGKRMLLSTKNEIQLWDVSSRMKLYELGFDHDINAFINNEGTKVLIFEVSDGKSFDDFDCHSLDISTGVLSSKPFNDNPYPFFDPTSYTCNCENIKGTSNEWICNDGSAILWKIDTETKVISEYRNFKNEAFYRTRITGFLPLPDSKKLMLSVLHENIDNYNNVTNSKQDNVFIYDFDNGSQTEVPQLNEAKYITPLSTSRLLYTTTSEVKGLNLETNQSTSILDITGKDYVELLRGNNQTGYVVASNNIMFNDATLNQIDASDFKIGKTYPIKTGTDFFTTHGFVNFLQFDAYQSENNLIGLSTEQGRYVNWNSKLNYQMETTSKFELDGNGMLLLNNNELIDLKSLEIKNRLPQYKNFKILEGDKQLLLSGQVDDKQMYFMTSTYDEPEQPVWKSNAIPYTDFLPPNYIYISPNKKYALAHSSTINGLGSYIGEEPLMDFYFINLETHHFEKITSKFEIGNMDFTPDGKKFYILTGQSYNHNQKTIFYDPATLKPIETIEGHAHQFLKDNTFLQIQSQNLVVTQKDSQGKIKEKSYYSRNYLRTCLYAKDFGYLIAGSEQGNLFVWEETNQSPKKIIPLGTSMILQLEVSGNKLFALLSDGTIRIINLQDLSHELTLAISSNTDNFNIAWFTPEGYFKASKDNIRNFHFVKNLKAFPLLSYELFLNRPDIILNKLGYADDETVEIYKEAYLKRLKRYGLTEQTDFFSIERPEVTLLNKNQLSPVAKAEEIQVDLSFSSSAKTFTVYDNGVPVVSGKVPNSGKTSEKIKLLQGDNNISVITVDSKGFESDPETFSVINQEVSQKPVVHYVGIGVSKYVNSSMDLRYADKDVRSIAEYLGTKFENRITIDTLTNGQVTKENIANLKLKLMDTNINDIVIVSFSGHGLVDDDFNFYFATHDIDFDNPEARGLSYEAMQDLLSGIPARRKLLLLDACHSGEIDTDEELEQVAVANENVSQYTPKGSKVIKGKKTSHGLKNSFELMQSLFYDLERGNGSYVISAAGGKEFAFESEDWQNGVFTYSFIHALSELGYDTWKGKQAISISKLKEYIYNSVTNLTNGQQKPTARSENIEWDWELD